MSTIIELNPQDFARTQQGSCLMTATDTETGIKEPIALFNGRASGRTAINRNSLVYDVLPYEPAYTLVDGKMVLSEESSADESFGNTEDFSLLSQENLTVSVNENISPDGELTADSIYETSDTGIHRVSKPFSVTIGEKRTISVFVKKSLDRNLLINIDNILAAKALFDLETGVVIDTFEGASDFAVKVIDLGDYFRVFLTGTGTGSSNQAYFQLCEKSHTTVSDNSYQGDDNVKIVLWGGNLTNDDGSSYIRNYTSGTESRLSATGVKTPDISKYINSDEFVFRVKYKKQVDKPNRITCSDGTDSNTVRFEIGSNATGRIDFLVKQDGNTISSGLTTGVSEYDFNDYVLTVSNLVTKLYINGVEVASANNSFSTQPNKYNQIRFSSESGSSFYDSLGEYEFLQYYENISEAKKTLTYID